MMWSEAKLQLYLLVLQKKIKNRAFLHGFSYLLHKYNSARPRTVGQAYGMQAVGLIEQVGFSSSTRAYDMR
jgi:hypothetical protein